MTYSERVQIIRNAIIAGIKSCKSMVEEVGKFPRGASRINGIAVEIIPFEKIFSIHFRDCDDKRDESYPDWRYWLLYNGAQDNTTLLDMLEKEYEDSESAEKYMLMLGTAVAEALLCDEVVSILKSYSMAEFFVLNDLGGGPFDFVVMDLDGCVDANFCEIIKWKRNICKEAL